MAYKDYYQTLGVTRDASDDDIKRAYRKLARRYHPDVSDEKNAADHFKDVSEAYEVLKDPEKRAAYDQLGSEAQAHKSHDGAPKSDGFDFSGGGYTDVDPSEFSDFFEEMFGRGFGPSAGRSEYRSAGGMRGQDQTARMDIDLEDAFNSATQNVELQVPEVDNAGRMGSRTRSLRVTIPKGIRQGQQLKLKRQGTPGLDEGQAGDLYIEIGFRPHRFYRLDGADLSLDLPVAPWEAALGQTVQTPTPAGPVDLKIPAGSNNRRQLRLKGRGMPGKNAGDLYAVLEVRLPPQDDDEAQRLYREMADAMAFNPRYSLGVQ